MKAALVSLTRAEGGFVYSLDFQRSGVHPVDTETADIHSGQLGDFDIQVGVAH